MKACALVKQPEHLGKQLPYESAGADRIIATAGYSYRLDPINRRVIVENYSRETSPEQLAMNWIELAQSQGLDKIWLWAFLQDVPLLLDRGFVLEGLMADDSVNKPAASLAYFLSSERERSACLLAEQDLLAQIMAKPIEQCKKLPANFWMRQLEIDDCNEISYLLTRVFTTYPTPVQEPAYIQKLLAQGCLFLGAFHGKKLVSLVAAYPDQRWMRCEITDCATLPAYRGHGLTEQLIRQLETLVLHKGSYGLYTLARAISAGMNRVFYKLGYRYGGRLVKNCDIAGQFEDMNLWVRY